jgi:outer membrane lipoprotein SlyB
VTRLSRLRTSHWRTALGAVAGAAAGALYAHFVGCRTGTCPLTSSVWGAGLYGAFVGAVAGWPARAPRNGEPGMPAHSP